MHVNLHCCSVVFLTPASRSAPVSTAEPVHAPHSPQIAKWMPPYRGYEQAIWAREAEGEPAASPLVVGEHGEEWQLGLQAPGQGRQ